MELLPIFYEKSRSDPFQLILSCAETDLFRLIESCLPFDIRIGILEVIVVAGFYFGGSLGEQFYQNGFIMSVLLLVGVGTIAHSMVDYAISVLIWKPCQHVIRIPVYAKVS